MSVSYSIIYLSKLVYPKGNYVNIRKSPTVNSEKLMTAYPDKLPGRTTGRYIDRSDGRWLEILLYNPISGNKYAWVRLDVARLVKSSSQSSTLTDDQKIANKIIKNDIDTFHSLLRMSAVMKRSKNLDPMDQVRFIADYNYLKRSINARQEILKRNGTVKEGYKKGYGQLSKEWRSTGGGKIGFVISGTIILIIVLTTVVATAGLFYWLTPAYDESKKDLKLSNELEDLLNSADPETAEKIKDDLEKQIDDAYHSGRTRGKFSGMFSIAKPLLFLAGGYLLVDRVIMPQLAK